MFFCVELELLLSLMTRYLEIELFFEYTYFALSLCLIHRKQHFLSQKSASVCIAAYIKGRIWVLKRVTKHSRLVCSAPCEQYLG